MQTIAVFRRRTCGTQNIHVFIRDTCRCTTLKRLRVTTADTRDKSDQNNTRHYNNICIGPDRIFDPSVNTTSGRTEHCIGVYLNIMCTVHIIIIVDSVYTIVKYEK